jgi:hypothetical protein
MDERYMNINPDYQREVVWSDARMSHLIDSLFNNYYVPPLIFKVVSGVKPGTTERRKWRTCIDGKQRLTAIRKFFDGEIPYIDKNRQKWYYRPPSQGPLGKSKFVLPDEEIEFINNVQIVNIEYEYLTEEQEEDMFQRVQLGVPLTIAEKLAALSGGASSFINDLRLSYPKLPDLMGKKRSADFWMIAELVYTMHLRIEEQDELKLKSSKQSYLRKFLEDKDYNNILTPSFRAQVRRVFAKYNELISTFPETFTHSFGKGKTTKNKKFSPVEFLGVGVMLDVYTERPTRVLAEDIKAFREYLRERLQDLRLNALAWTHVMDFINALEDSRGYYPPETLASNKRIRTASGSVAVQRRNSSFNPPSPDRQTHLHPSSVYNSRQQEAMQARLTAREQEQREAFQRIPPSRESPRWEHIMAGGARGPTIDDGGGRKRTIDGVPIKREGRNCGNGSGEYFADESGFV